MNKDLPKWVNITGAILIGIVALLVFFNYDRIHVYGTYIREKSPEIATRFVDLSADMDEAAARKHFEGVPFSCTAQGPGSDSLGDRVCYTAIDKADGDAALMLAVFFRKGKLAHAMIETPWWVHKTWMQRFMTDFGQPQRAGMVSRFGGPVMRWSMPNGYVETRRDRSFNPLEWNVILWTGTRQRD